MSSPYKTDIVYLYDGSFDGLLCCVFESYYKKELPFAIYDYGQQQDTLFVIKEIVTDIEKAQRVEKSIFDKISKEAFEMLRLCYLSHFENCELSILHFVRLGFKVGGKVVDMLSHKAVIPVAAAVKHILGEAHLFKGFIRFSDFNGALVAIFEPKNFILPLVAPHFCDRFPNEQFLIYDKTHKHAFVQEKGRRQLIPLEHLELPEASDEEQMYRSLWKQFYDTIAIEGRVNPKLRANNMPLRYRAHMTEFM